MKPIRWIPGKIVKFALDIIIWVETLRLHVFELKLHIHTRIT